MVNPIPEPPQDINNNNKSSKKQNRANSYLKHKYSENILQNERKDFVRESVED